VAAGLSIDEASRAVSWLEEKGFVSVSRTSDASYSFTKEGEEYLSAGFPELRVLSKAAKNASVASLDEVEKRVGLAWARRNNWVKIAAGGALEMTGVGAQALGEREIERAAKSLHDGKGIDEEALKSLMSRGLVQQRLSKQASVSITPSGSQAAMQLGTDSGNEEINQLTRDLISSKAWKGKSLRQYDISQDVDFTEEGKRHIISRFSRQVKGIFVQMGFEEMEGSIVESSFWNFDALFQPQDHPARELADTFYANSSFQLPSDKKLVAAVKKAHEQGWKYQWSEEEAKKAVLRTHTTAVSARNVAKSAGCGPKKFFCIGKVFRKEATDFKHLAEFYQVEGIVVWEQATLPDLLGILSEFYRRIGFEKIRFRPSFFPYTEPSLEIEVYFEKKKAWLEIGGAGIFRPEVSIPLCGRYPVLAWGLSLERPLMLLHDIGDIRSFYQNQVGWLRSMPVRK